jgi:hypothetical protein
MKITIETINLAVQEWDNRATRWAELADQYSELSNENINKLNSYYIKEISRHEDIDVDINTKIKRAELVIKHYEQNKIKCETKARQARGLVQKLRDNDSVFIKALEELNDKLNACCNPGYQYDLEICKRLKILIEMFMLAEHDDCKQYCNNYLSQCKALPGWPYND